MPCIAVSRPCSYILLGWDSLCPSLDLYCGARGARAEIRLGLGYSLGCSWKLVQSSQQSVCFLGIVSGVEACTCMSWVESKFLTSLVSYPLVFKPVKSIQPSVWDFTVWDPSMCFKLLTPGRISEHV